MKNLFVPYELALKLVEKGFDEKCLALYRNKKIYTLDAFYIINSEKVSVILAPLYQQVLDWLDTKNIHISKIWYDDGVTKAEYTYHINKEYIGRDLNKAIEEALKLI